MLSGDDDMTQAFDDLLRGRFIFGDPAQCADEAPACASWRSKSGRGS